MTTQQTGGTPPVARQEPFQHTQHGVARPDPYHWMHDAGSAEVLGHLAAERAWYDASVAHLRSLVTDLKSEMVARVPATDRSPAWNRRRFSYYTLTPAGREYPRICRMIRHDPMSFSTESSGGTQSGDDIRTTPSDAPEVLLDVAELAEGKDYLELGVTVVSPDEGHLAYSADATGDEVYRLRFRDLTTGEDLAEEVPRTYYGGAWSADSQWFFYTVHDAAYRPFQVWRHRIGSPVADDVLVAEELDERFELRVRGTRSGDWVVVWAESNTTAETWLVDAHDPTAPPRRAGGRRDGVRYRVDHRRHEGGDDLLVVVDDRVEGRLLLAPVPGPEGHDWTAWREARPENPAEHLERADAFGGGVVLALRTGGAHLLRVVPHDDLAAPGRDVTSAVAAGGVHLARTTEYDVDRVLVRDESWLAPPVWSEVSLATGERTEVLRHEAPGFDPGDYLTERVELPAPDGTAVPASVMRHRDTPLDGSAPAVLYGYGAYGYTFEPEWDPALPSILDRGVVWVHAHVRGGSEGGRAWYLDGKLDRKQHTFDDLVAVADGLADRGLVDPARIASRGLSAGGLLQGAVFSQRPDRWRAVVAEVPFVDVVTTMFDEATPLTITEWEEWGDPRVRAEFDAMLAWSPYDNLPPAGGRPDLLVTGAVHDPRVMVREPAKWVAALRDSDPEWSPRCLFRCEVGAGAHVGPSGRFGHLAYEAEVYAWLLDRLGLTEEASS
ncbi:S9 family peptidase [Nocardioides euryhalodurans]|uniref:S9 family peptidase n=1 Tax=Nocardioides euryhalodurans TaxID=2518370 RepID=UPI0014238919|nr:prolyl oligopeptidase family serine peptidase [Nocardioides euryhalodurans]